MQQRILVVLEKAGNNYSAYAPDVPGCISTGSTKDDTLRQMKEALQGHLALIARDGDAMPEITAIEAGFVEVDVPLPTAAQQAS